MKFYLVISITFVFIGSTKEDIGGVPCPMTGWTEWTKCSKTCGNGTRLRWKFPIYNPEDCEGEEIFDSEICNLKCCPVDSVQRSDNITPAFLWWERMPSREENKTIL